MSEYIAGKDILQLTNAGVPMWISLLVCIDNTRKHRSPCFPWGVCSEDIVVLNVIEMILPLVLSLLSQMIFISITIFDQGLSVCLGSWKFSIDW